MSRPRRSNGAGPDSRPGEMPDSRQREAPDSRRGAAIGLLVVLLLIVGGIVLAHVLRKSAQLQDCVLSGRTNCAPIDVDSGR